jgi:periplasmic protein TonB
MFEQTFIAPGKSRREQTIVLALGLQALAVLALLLVPLMTVERIGAEKRLLIRPPTILVDQPVKPQVETHHAPVSTPRVFVLPVRNSPAYLVPHVGPLAPTDAPVISASGQGDALPGGIPGLDATGVPGPPTFQQVAPTHPKVPAPPLRVSIGVSQSQLEYGPKPEYPQIARISRTEGTVRLQAIISRDGRIENLHVLSGHPLLIGAAMQAVRQWRYRPMLLNGDPVEVITEIDVNFTLRQ